ncbi:hypothetical protein V3M80_06875 [Trueperella pyogenes]
MFMDCFWAITLAYWAYYLIPNGIVTLVSWVVDKREERRYVAMLEEERARIKASEVAKAEASPL